MKKDMGWYEMMAKMTDLLDRAALDMVEKVYNQLADHLNEPHIQYYDDPIANNLFWEEVD